MGAQAWKGHFVVPTMQIRIWIGRRSFGTFSRVPCIGWVYAVVFELAAKMAAHLETKTTMSCTKRGNRRRTTFSIARQEVPPLRILRARPDLANRSPPDESQKAGLCRPPRQADRVRNLARQVAATVAKNAQDCRLGLVDGWRADPVEAQGHPEISCRSLRAPARRARRYDRLLPSAECRFPTARRARGRGRRGPTTRLRSFEMPRGRSAKSDRREAAQETRGRA